MKLTDTILLVEDDDIDQTSVKRAFRDLNIANPLSIVGSGGLKWDQSWRKVSLMVQSILSVFVGPVSFKI